MDIYEAVEVGSKVVAIKKQTAVGQPAELVTDELETVRFMFAREWALQKMPANPSCLKSAFALFIAICYPHLIGRFK